MDIVILVQQSPSRDICRLTKLQAMNQGLLAFIGGTGAKIPQGACLWRILLPEDSLP
jgi:hypothetical protein